MSAAGPRVPSAHHSPRPTEVLPEDGGDKEGGVPTDGAGSGTAPHGSPRLRPSASPRSCAIPAGREQLRLRYAKEEKNRLQHVGNNKRGEMKSGFSAPRAQLWRVFSSSPPPGGGLRFRRDGAALRQSARRNLCLQQSPTPPPEQHSSSPGTEGENKTIDRTRCHCETTAGTEPGRAAVPGVLQSGVPSAASENSTVTAQHSTAQHGVGRWDSPRRDPSGCSPPFCRP